MTAQIDLLNAIIPCLRDTSAPIGWDSLTPYAKLNAEYRAVAKPYFAMRATDVLTFLKADLNTRSTVDLAQDALRAGILLLPYDERTATAFVSAVKRAIVADQAYVFTLELVHGANIGVAIYASGIELSVPHLQYQARWYYDQAVEVCETLERAIEDDKGSPFRQLRVLFRAIDRLTGSEGFLHEAYDQASWYDEVREAEGRWMDDVVQDCAPSELDKDAARTTLAAVLSDLDVYIETEESLGSMGACGLQTNGAPREDIAHEIAEAWGLASIGEDYVDCVGALLAHLS